MKRLAPLLALVLLFGLVPITNAGTQGSSCSVDLERALLWEELLGTTADGNDNLWMCGTGIPSLHAISHTLPGNCRALGITYPNWGDCISSVTLWMPASRKFCIYRDVNYGGASFCWLSSNQGQRHNFTGPAINFNDTTSSARFLNDSTPP